MVMAGEKFLKGKKKRCDKEQAPVVSRFLYRNISIHEIFSAPSLSCVEEHFRYWEIFWDNENAAEQASQQPASEQAL